MNNIVLALITVGVCLMSDTASRATTATTRSALPVVLPSDIGSRSSGYSGQAVIRGADPTRTLSFEERVMYQRAIEEVC